MTPELCDIAGFCSIGPYTKSMMQTSWSNSGYYGNPRLRFGKEKVIFTMTAAMVCTNARPGKFLFILNFSIPFLSPFFFLVLRNLAKEVFKIELEILPSQLNS